MTPCAPGVPRLQYPEQHVKKGNHPGTPGKGSIQMKSWFGALLPILAGLGSLNVSAQGFDPSAPILEGVEIRVNDEVITIGEVDDFMLRAEYERGRPFSEAEFPRVRRDIQDRLVDEALLVQEARKRGYTVDKSFLEAEVEKEWQKRVERRGGPEALQSSLRESGMTEEAVRKLIAFDVERDELRRRMMRSVMGSDTSVTIEDIEQFRVRNPQQARNLETIGLSHILLAVPQDAAPEEEEVARKSAWDLLTRIRAEGPDSFEKYAQMESDHEATKERGGSLGTVHRGDLYPQFDTAFDMNVGEISEPVRTPQGYHLLKVTGKRTVAELIYQQKIDEALSGLLKELRKNAVVVVRGRD